MRRKTQIVCIILSFALVLTGCSSKKSLNNGIETKVDISDKKVDNNDYITTSDKKYVQKMAIIADDYHTGLSNINRLMTNINLESEDWLNELALSILLVQQTCDTVNNTIAPEKFLRMHRDVSKASYYFSTAMDNIANVVDTLDETSASNYAKNIKIANEHMEKATNELNKIREKYKF